jgi:hypothetical protein
LALGGAGVRQHAILRQLFNGYSRALFIDTKMGESEHFESLFGKFAEKVNLGHESRDGALEVLREGLRKARSLANRC